MQTQERVCWNRLSDWKYCKASPASYSTEMRDYLNWLFEKQQVNLKIVSSGVGLPRTIEPRWYGNSTPYLQSVRRSYGADIVLLVNPFNSDGKSGGCGPAGEVCWVSDERAIWYHPPKQSVAHEFGHHLHLNHWHEPFAGKFGESKPYAGGHGSWAWVDLMHYSATHGKGLIKYDIYSDHEHWCGFERCGIQNYASAGQYLREVWGRYVRPGGSPPKPPKFPDGGHPGNGRN